LHGWRLERPLSDRVVLVFMIAVVASLGAGRGSALVLARDSDYADIRITALLPRFRLCRLGPAIERSSLLRTKSVR
jgi:hypothetical protein